MAFGRLGRKERTEQFIGQQNQQQIRQGGENREMDQAEEGIRVAIKHVCQKGWPPLRLLTLFHVTCSLPIHILGLIEITMGGVHS